MRVGVKYAAVIVLAAMSALTILNADAIGEWGRHTLRPLLRWDDVWVIPTVLIIFLPSCLLAGILIGLTSRAVRRRVPEKWRRWI
jgi:hypothetical protein